MSEERPTVYIETTIPSYLAAEPSQNTIVLAQQQITHAWWNKRRPDFQCFTSDYVIDEISAGDPIVSMKRLALVGAVQILEANAEVRRLTTLYERELGLTGNARGDVPHFAFSVAHGIEYLLTWNCSHIANGRIIRRLASINLKHGLSTPTIVTPNELMEA